MYFQTGIKAYVLFESWYTDTNRDIIIACVVIFLVAILNEWFRVIPDYGGHHRILHHRTRSPYSPKRNAISALGEIKSYQATICTPNRASTSIGSIEQDTNDTPTPKTSSVGLPSDTEGKGEDTTASHSKSVKSQVLNFHHAVKSLLHIVHVTVLYSLMLVTMTFNLWIFLAVICGSGVGYFLHLWLKLKMTKDDATPR